MSKESKAIIDKMTGEQKMKMLSGKNFWQTQDYTELGIPMIKMADGPCGLRKQIEKSDHLGIYGSIPSTAHITGPGLASSWNRDLVHEVGSVLGQESKAYDVSLLLGPAVNIQRSPLCGRHFEYFSEDPYLTSEVAYQYIKGVQQHGVGTCIKHYAANNQETEREYIDAVIDERALREIYLAAFEKPICEAKPWAVMAALNKVNGNYCAENEFLLRDILRDEWKYEGVTISDWFGVNNRIKSLEAGLDLEMPYSEGVSEKQILEALKSGDVSEEYINESCERLIDMALKTRDFETGNMEYDKAKHHEFVQKAAEECMVLLKNEGDILPISKSADIAVIGEFAKKPHFTMEGSALVNPTYQDIPMDEIARRSRGQVVYVQGFSMNEEKVDIELQTQAADAAGKAQVALIFAGLPNGYETEGHDRKNLHLPENQVALIQAVSAVQENVVVILSNGSPVDMPWIQDVKGIYECFLAGQGMGSAIAKLLFGEANPSAKLPVTFPQKVEHTSSYLSFPGNKIETKYEDSIFVGYRYFDKKSIEPLFPFGFGLSYTKFEIKNLVLSKEKMTDADKLIVKAAVKNIGQISGAEVVQLYVGQFDSSVKKAVRELKGFEKVFLQPGECKEVSFALSRRDFAFYHVGIKEWTVDEGDYRIEIGNSSRNIMLSKSVHITPAVKIRKQITGWSKVEDLKKSAVGLEFIERIKEVAKSAEATPFFAELVLDPKKKEEFEQLPLRFITLYSNNLINNDIMENMLLQVNEKSNRMER